MNPEAGFVQKAVGCIVRSNESGQHQLLGYLSDPGVPYRFVGGKVEAGEEPEAALLREIREESGLTGLTIVRKLGVQNYYKPYIAAYVVRHDYLLVPTMKLPERREHVVTGSGGDDGAVFRFEWLNSGEHDRIDPEFRDLVRDAYIPELFNV